MDKQTVAHTYNGILFSLERKKKSAICYNMINLENIMLTEVSQSRKDKYCIIYNLFIILDIILILYAMIYYLLLLYEVLRIVKLVRTESTMVVAKDWGRRKMES